MKRHRSFAVRLSLRFMFVLTSAVILLSLGFIFFLRSLVKANQSVELKTAEARIINVLNRRQKNFVITNLPYYITYVAYDTETSEVLVSNDPFLPLLPDSGGKALHHFEKDFFFDGNLDIYYFAATHRLANRNIVVVVAENMENDTFTIIFNKLPITFLLMSLPVLLLSFLVCLYITKQTISPVVKITKTARSMTTENLDGQLPMSGRGDEIDGLSQAFNELFLRVKADFDRERQFSNDVAHELNTPLTVISGQANLLLRWGKENPEQLEKSLNAIKNESKSMHAIIEHLLQISRVESGRVKPQLTRVLVNEIFERIAYENAEVFSDVKFAIECEPSLSLETDWEMLHQILTVLVSNSIKFSGGKCNIKLSAERCDDVILITERDDGPGISQEALPHIFERFYRGDEAHTRAAGGSGLGLAIAKTLSEALDAEISARNAEPQGAIFELILPVDHKDLQEKDTQNI